MGLCDPSGFPEILSSSWNTYITARFTIIAVIFFSTSAPFLNLDSIVTLAIRHMCGIAMARGKKYRYMPTAKETPAPRYLTNSAPFTGRFQRRSICRKLRKRPNFGLFENKKETQKSDRPESGQGHTREHGCSDPLGPPVSQSEPTSYMSCQGFYGLKSVRINTGGFV